MKIIKTGLAAAFCLLIPFCAAGCGGDTKEIVWEQTEESETASGHEEESGNLAASSVKDTAENANEDGSKETAGAGGTQKNAKSEDEAGDSETYLTGDVQEADEASAAAEAQISEEMSVSEDSQEYIGAVGTAIPEGQIYVDICGAVAHPGVYRLPEGARLYQVVELAGGLTDEADLTVLNQASSLTDGMKIQVYTREEVLAMEESGGTASAAGTGSGSSSGSAAGAGGVSADSGTVAGASSDSTAGGTESAAGLTSDGKVNLNTADKETLKTLTGIGDVKAQLILDWRTEHGGFSSIEEIMQISGIKEGTFNKIKDNIAVE